MKFVFSIREVWNIAGEPYTTQKSVRAKVPKKILYQFILDTFDPEHSDAPENPFDNIPHYDYYDVTYIGNPRRANPSQLMLEYGADYPQIFFQNQTISIEDRDSPLMQAIFKRANKYNDMHVQGRRFYSHETELIDVYNLIRMPREDKDQRFFEVY